MDVFQRRPKPDQSVVKCLDVRAFWTHKNVHVPGGTRLRVNAHRPPPDNEIPNAMGMEGKKKIAKIAV